MMAAPIERKVQASTGVAAVSGMALWILGKYVFKGDVPDVVASWVYVLVPGILTFAAGYLTKHTSRSQQVQVVNNTTGTNITFSAPADPKPPSAEGVQP